MQVQQSLKNVLNKIIAKRGKEVLRDEKVFLGMLSDYGPALVKERKLFKLVFLENIMDKLLEFDQGTSRVSEKELLESCVNELSELYGVGREEIYLLLKGVLDSLTYQEISDDIFESELAKDLPLICTKAYEGSYIAVVLFASKAYLFSDKERESFYFEIFRLATTGNSFAQVCMGDYYADGVAVKKNWKIAYIWYKTAADAGNPAGLNACGYYMGMDRSLSREERFEKEKELFQEAAQKGYWMAKNNLAYVFVEERNFDSAKKKYQEVIEECPSPYLRDYAILNFAIALHGKIHDLAASQYWVAKILDIKDYDDKILLLEFMSKHRDLGYDTSYIVQELEKVAEAGYEKGIITLIVLYSGKKGRPEAAISFTDEEYKQYRNTEKCKYWIERYIDSCETLSRDIIDLYLLGLPDEQAEMERIRINNLHKYSDEDEYAALFHDMKWCKSQERIEECKSILKQKKFIDCRKHSMSVIKEIIHYYGSESSECRDTFAMLVYMEQFIALQEEHGKSDGNLDYRMYRMFQSDRNDFPANPMLADYWYKQASRKNCTMCLIEKAKHLLKERKYYELRRFLENNKPGIKEWNSKEVSVVKEYTDMWGEILGLCYHFGEGGVEVDHAKAASFFQVSNSIKAINHLAAYYKNGYPDFPKNLQKYEEYKAKAGADYVDLS